MRGSSVIGIIISMGLVAALIMLYMRVSIPGGAAGVKNQTTAIERAQDQANQTNRLQKERQAQFDQIAP